MFRFLNIKAIILLLVFSISILAFIAEPAQAKNLKDAWETVTGVAGQAGYDTDANEIEPLIGTIITAVLSFLGVIFMVLMIYGGYLWMTDRGNEEQVKRAKNLINAAIIGLIIILLAYAISIYVLSKLTAATLTEGA